MVKRKVRFKWAFSNFSSFGLPESSRDEKNFLGSICETLPGKMNTNYLPSRVAEHCTKRITLACDDAKEFLNGNAGQRTQIPRFRHAEACRRRWYDKRFCIPIKEKFKRNSMMASYFNWSDHLYYSYSSTKDSSFWLKGWRMKRRWKEVYYTCRIS